MFDSSVGDFIAKFGHLVGWTVIVGIAWRLRGIVETQVTLWKNIDSQTKSAVSEVIVVKEKVDTMQTNHMAHMQRDLESLTKSNDKAVDVLQDISRGISVLVDRGNREPSDKDTKE